MSEDTGNYRAEIESQYQTEQGIIRSPGKFEGEPLYVPYYWQMGLDGCADYDQDGVFTFVIGDQERNQFPELGEAKAVQLEESEQGFVYHKTLTATEYQDYENQPVDSEDNS